MSLPLVQEYLAQHEAEAVEELFGLLRIPSVSAVTEHRPDVRRAAEFVCDALKQAGCTAEIVETKGHPIVYGEWLGAPGAPTALVYGHYDVQPEDPVDKWHSPPFEPTIRDDHVYARGATDDKGQFFTHVRS
ncbi:MAG: M20/M25/M40 family metallo-hydrolase, partial [Planctomycetaceae bacterium]|nr:M20/M25/M40 family metallo-hydrolase [Planctomycetaceae bacterium]